MSHIIVWNCIAYWDDLESAVKQISDVQSTNPSTGTSLVFRVVDEVLAVPNAVPRMGCFGTVIVDRIRERPQRWEINHSQIIRDASFEAWRDWVTTSKGKIGGFWAEVVAEIWSETIVRRHPQ